MRIQFFQYKETRVLNLRLQLTHINNKPERQQFFCHEMRDVPHHLQKDEDSIKNFLTPKILEIVHREFPEYKYFKFDFDLIDLYYERVGRASILLNHKTHKFTINEDGQWQVNCKKLTSGMNMDYSLMFNKLNELVKAIRGF